MFIRQDSTIYNKLLNVFNTIFYSMALGEFFPSVSADGPPIVGDRWSIAFDPDSPRLHCHPHQHHVRRFPAQEAVISGQGPLGHRMTFGHDEWSQMKENPKRRNSKYSNEKKNTAWLLRCCVFVKMHSPIRVNKQFSNCKQFAMVCLGRVHPTSNFQLTTPNLHSPSPSF